MKKTKLALVLVVLLTMFSFVLAETDQITFSITVEQNTPDWANVQFPIDTTVALGNSCIFYAQVWENGKTPGQGQFADINAWIGYNSSDVSVTDPGWTWVEATYNTTTSSESTNGFANDEYYVELASSLPEGTYYIASRFAFNGDNNNVTYGLAGDTANAILRIQEINHAPIFASIADKNVAEDESLSFTLSASDSDNDPLTYSIFSNDQSDDISVTILNDRLTIIPNPDFFTSTDANIVVKVSDGNGGEDTESFKLTVNAVNDAPVIAAVANQNVSEGSELTVTFSATDIDNSLAQLSWSESNIPSGSVFTPNGDGTAKLVWTPDYTQAGDHTGITITVSDGLGGESRMIINTNNKNNK